jgi:hypothetical protein
LWVHVVSWQATVTFPNDLSRLVERMEGGSGKASRLVACRWPTSSYPVRSQFYSFPACRSGEIGGDLFG